LQALHKKAFEHNTLTSVHTHKDLFMLKLNVFRLA